MWEGRSTRSLFSGVVVVKLVLGGLREWGTVIFGGIWLVGCLCFSLGIFSRKWDIFDFLLDGGRGEEMGG